MYFELTNITPQTAFQMLQTQDRNRRVNQDRVKIIANDMSNGKWTTSPHPICFDEHGNLMDGQHRLYAIIKANIALDMWVAKDVPHDAIIDKGLPRSTGDALYMRGLISYEISKRKYTSIVNAYMTALNHHAVLSDTDKAVFIQQHERDIKRAYTISTSGVSKNVLCRSAQIRAAILAALLSGVDESDLIDFCSVVNSGFMDNHTQSAAIVLRNFIIENKNRLNHHNNMFIAYTEMAIKDFVEKNVRREAYAEPEHIYIVGNSVA